MFITLFAKMHFGILVYKFVTDVCGVKPFFSADNMFDSLKYNKDNILHISNTQITEN